MLRLSPKTACVFRFGPFELDAAAPELRKAGISVKIPPQPLNVLSILVGRAGQIVSRDDICRQIWGENTYVDFELSLNYCLNRIRAALEDNSEAPFYVLTLPRRGYRFIAPVEYVRTVPPILAILPFENLNRTPEEDFLADAVADALTTELGNVSTLRLISRQSVLHFKGTQKTVPEIARELKADAVVEGSVLQAEGRIRITAQLVQVDPEQHLWAKAYECAMGDILTTQGQVARAIAEAVEVVLTPAEIGRLSRARPVDPEAHLAYLKGRHHMGRWSRDSFQKALHYFQAALQKDPSHASAHAHMADCYALLGHWGHLPFREAFQKAKQAALTALTLDASLSTAHWALAWATWVHDWDLATCEIESLRAIQLNPSNELAHVGYSIFLAVIREDRARALNEVKLALDLDPLSQYVHTDAAWVHLFVGNYGRAIEQAQKALELFPESLQAYYVLGLAEMCRSRFAEAIAAFEHATAISRDAISITYLGSAHARAGDIDIAVSLLHELESRSAREHVPPRCFVFLYASLGEQDRAFEWLEKAYLARDSGLFFMRAMPLYEPLHKDPRFKDMLHRIGLLQARASSNRP